MSRVGSRRPTRAVRDRIRRAYRRGGNPLPALRQRFQGIGALCWVDAGECRRNNTRPRDALANARWFFRVRTRTGRGYVALFPQSVTPTQPDITAEVELGTDIDLLVTD